MASVTNRVDPASLAHLLAAPPRATLTWIQAERLELAPVRYRSASGRHFVALAEGAPAPPVGAPASLVLDDGWSRIGSSGGVFCMSTPDRDVLGFPK